MPIPVPRLDDRRFDDLVTEGRAMIPALAPDWTNHNASDPGITLVELFAHLTEMLIYRLDRVTPATICRFLNLLDNGSRTPNSVPPERLEAEIRNVMRQLRILDRAVSCRDFEVLALQASKGTLKRVRCIPSRNLEGDADTDEPGHISVVVLPPSPLSDDGVKDLLDQVNKYLDDRRLLTTRVHVVLPRFVTVALSISVVPDPADAPALRAAPVQEDLPAFPPSVNIAVSIGVVANRDRRPAEVVTAVRQAVEAFLSPYIGGEDGAGWPFGRGIFVSDLYVVAAQTPGVNYVASVSLVEQKRAGRIVTAGTGDDAKPIGVSLEPYELVAVVAQTEGAS